MSLAVVGQIEQSLRDLLVEPFVVEGRIQRDRLLDNMLPDFEQHLGRRLIKLSAPNRVRARHEVILL